MLSVAVNGTNRSGQIRYESIRITKDGASEECVLETYSTRALGFRIREGDELRITRAGVLEFGGEAFVIGEPILGRGGITTQVRAKGWRFQAAEIKQVRIAFPSQEMNVTVAALYSRFLAAKGWTNLTPPTGGPVLPALYYEGVSVEDILNDLQTRSLIPWRVNGDRQMAFQPAGTFTAPYTLTQTNSVVKPGGRVQRSKVRYATRLFARTGGAGTVMHSETHIANGAMARFPLNVLPQKHSGSIRADAAYEAQTIQVGGLLANGQLKAGDTFLVAGSDQIQTLTADASVDGNGDATISFAPGLTAAVKSGHALTFDAGTFVQLRVNGTLTPQSGPWTFDHDEARVMVSGGAPAPGTAVRVDYPVTLGAIVRVWQPIALTAFGDWNYAEIRDAEADVTEQTDLEMAANWARAELAARYNQPNELTVETFAQGVYPWMRQMVNLPAAEAVGAYMVQRVELTDVGAREPSVTLMLLEGDAIGPDWRRFFLNRNGSGTAGGSISSGGTIVAPGGSSPGTGGGGGGGYPIGHSFLMGGANDRAITLTSAWRAVPLAVPRLFGGAGMAGTWRLRVPMYQTAAGTMEARLIDQDTGAVLATVSSTRVAALFSDDFGSVHPSALVTVPAGVDDVILEVRVTAGARDAVVGMATLVREA